MKRVTKLQSQKSIIKFRSRPNIFIEESLVELNRYVRGEFWQKEIAGEKFDFDFGNATSSLELCAIYYTDQGVVSVLSAASDWRAKWERGVLFRYWAETLRILFFKYYQAEHPGFDRTKAGRAGFGATGFTLGNCLALGWLDAAKALGEEINYGLDRKWFYDGDCNTMERRTQHFVLRLVASWQGWPERSGLPCLHDEPIFNVLIEQWRTADVQALGGLLLRALERHAEHTQNDVDDDETLIYYDCNRDDEIYNPMEVLSALRLREVLGLPNPPVPKHPVADTPLGRELPPASPFPKDELIEGVLARIRRDHPNLTF